MPRDRAWAKRLFLFLVGGALAAGYVWLAGAVYRAQLDPRERPPRADASLLGPTAATLDAAADAEIADALERLNDTLEAPSARLDSYRSHLRTAEGLLVSSLEAQPAQARTLARLAAIRWEIDPPKDEDSERRSLEVVEVASRMAPRVPAVQLELGRLLLKMGMREDAERHLALGLELDASASEDVVSLLREHVYSAGEILAILPKEPEVLVALKAPFSEEGDLASYVRAVEPVLGEASPPLVSAYAGACLELGRAEELADRLDALASSPDARVEAERLLQRSRARLALGSPREAIADARGAREHVPDDARMAEQVGLVAAAAGEPGLALEALRASLALVARGSGDPRWRARLYREIGKAEEQRGDPVRAYDAYRKTLELVADDPHALQRVAEMRRSAGLAPPGSRERSGSARP